MIFGMVMQSRVVPMTQSETVWLNHLADFGLLFLMYISGMEVDIHKLRPSRHKGDAPSALYLGLATFTGTLLLTFGISFLVVHLTSSTIDPYMLTLLFATTSLGVILPVLEETHVLDKPFGQTLLTSALIADFLTMLLISLFVSTRTDSSFGHVLMTLAIIPFAAMVYVLLRAIQRVPGMRRLAGDAQLRVRAILALLSITVALADSTGAEPILGAFLVGMMVSAMPFAFKDKLRDYSHGIGYGFFIPLFFISVGLDFDFHGLALSETLLWIPVLVGIAFAVKLIPAMQLIPYFGLRNAFAAGFLLSARLSLIAAAAQMGVRIGALSQQFADAVILVAIVTSMVSPILFVVVGKHAESAAE